MCLVLYVSGSPHSSNSSFLPLSEIQGCGFTSTENTGVIKTQDWPMNYKANADCMWNIVAPVGKKIQLKFTHFDVEPVDIFTSKCYDNIVVYDINSQTNAMNQKFGKLMGSVRSKQKKFTIYSIFNQLRNARTHQYLVLISVTQKYQIIHHFKPFSGPFCGSTLPPAIQSKGSRLVIRFQTDLMTEGKGFRGYWTTDPSLPAPTEAPVLPKPWNNITIGAVLIQLCTFDCNVIAIILCFLFKKNKNKVPPLQFVGGVGQFPSRIKAIFKESSVDL